MVSVNHKIISTLNKLIEICKDGEKGYRLAAEKDKDRPLANIFKEYSNQRSLFVSELRNTVARMGEKPEDSGTLAGTAHRGWFRVKSAAAGDREGAIVSECERGEDAAVKTYREALKAGLPVEVRSIVEQQYEKVKAAHDRMRTLEIESKNMSSDGEDTGTVTDGAPD